MMPRLLGFLLLGLLPWVAAACTPLDPAPFEQFAGATKQLGPAMDAAFALDLEWTEESLRAALTTDPAAAFTALALELDPETFTAARTNDPLFLKLRRARGAAAALNAAVAMYAAVLAALAGDEALDGGTFDALARDLQAQSTAAAGAFAAAMRERNPEFTLPSGVAKGTGIFSVGAAEAFRWWVEHARRDHLAEAIERNQPTVEQWAKLGRDALAGIADDLADEYQNRRRRLGLTLLRADTATTNTQAVDEAIALEVRVRAAMDTLRGLDATLAALPAAHAALGTHAAGAAVTLDALRDYQAHAAHLQQLYRALIHEDE